MTEGHLTTGVLHDQAEGLLEGAAAAAAARHLAACAACAAEVEAVRRLRSAAAALPPALDPGVDLRSGIRAGVRSVRRRSAWLAAAAVLIVAIPAGLGVARLLGGEGSGAAGGSEASASETVLTLDREYARAARELTATLTAGPTGLSPEAARLLRGSLDEVERALAESRAALREDPGSPVLRALVLAMHRQRLDVLRHAAALAAEGEARS